MPSFARRTPSVMCSGRAGSGWASRIASSSDCFAGSQRRVQERGARDQASRTRLGADRAAVGPGSQQRQPCEELIGDRGVFLSASIPHRIGVMVERAPSRPP